MQRCGVSINVARNEDELKRWRQDQGKEKKIWPVAKEKSNINLLLMLKLPSEIGLSSIFESMKEKAIVIQIVAHLKRSFVFFC